MGFYYDIKENNDEKIICYKKVAWFYLFMWPFEMKWGQIFTLYMLA